MAGRAVAVWSIINSPSIVWIYYYRRVMAIGAGVRAVSTQAGKQFVVVMGVHKPRTEGGNRATARHPMTFQAIVRTIPDRLRQGIMPLMDWCAIFLAFNNILDEGKKIRIIQMTLAADA